MSIYACFNSVNTMLVAVLSNNHQIRNSTNIVLNKGKYLKVFKKLFKINNKLKNKL